MEISMENHEVQLLAIVSANIFFGQILERTISINYCNQTYFLNT